MYCQIPYISWQSCAVLSDIVHFRQLQPEFKREMWIKYILYFQYKMNLPINNLTMTVHRASPHLKLLPHIIVLGLRNND